MNRIVERRGRGFTLIELVIAIAIMSVVLAALYSSFLLADRALVQAGASSFKLQESRAFVDTLKREIEAVRYSRDNSFCVFKMDDRDFYGRQASSLTMTTTTPLMKGLAKINYAIEERDGSLVITKSMVSAFSREAEENRMDLVEDIESFTLQAKYQDTWVKTWDSSLSETAPDEVKITLTMRMKSNKKQASSAVPFSVFETAKLMVGRTL
ncbi:prepilin-type N-terminal cleavage/methylation domain-containing protein [bacterium]|nr:MAG: prepilin-type N-terminal cleavage/methylation domain-containing protein [bacterium]